MLYYKKGDEMKKQTTNKYESTFWEMRLSDMILIAMILAIYLTII